MGDTGLVLAAAGQGQRMQSRVNKILLELAGRPVISYSLDLFNRMEDIEQIIIVAREDEIPLLREMVLDKFPFCKEWRVVAGGLERQDSVRQGLDYMNDNLALAAVHDAARPLLPFGLAAGVIAAARKWGAACPVVPEKDTLRELGEGGFCGPVVDRSRVVRVQTPQVFRRSDLKLAHHRAKEEGFKSTDDAALYARYCGSVRAVGGDFRNFKLTTPEDFDLASGFLRRERVMRTGNGYDVHRLVEGRPLVVGGVRIPYSRGLEGHSDADVLVHAVCDSLLGAAAMGDIGRHFPDSEEGLRGISSLVLLERVGLMLREKGWRVENIDATLIAEVPRFAPYIQDMRVRMAGALEIEPERVAVKATTTEGLGFTGRGEGIAAQATALLSALSPVVAGVGKVL